VLLNQESLVRLPAEPTSRFKFANKAQPTCASSGTEKQFCALFSSLLPHHIFRSSVDEILLISIITLHIIQRYRTQCLQSLKLLSLLLRSAVLCSGPCWQLASSTSYHSSFPIILHLLRPRHWLGHPTYACGSPSLYRLPTGKTSLSVVSSTFKLRLVQITISARNNNADFICSSASSHLLKPSPFSSRSTLSSKTN